MPIPSVDAGACHGFFQNMNIHNGPLQEALLLCVGRTMFINEMLLMRGSFLYARVSLSIRTGKSSSSCLTKPRSLQISWACNPSVELYLWTPVTAEDESGICIWDLRMPKVPIKELPGHTHWTWTVKCNPEYGLILVLSLSNLYTNTNIGNLENTLSVFFWPCISYPGTDTPLDSAGTDSSVNLWLASMSSNDDLTSESPIESPTRQVDPLLNSYSDYEDSVYGLAWSSREPSIFASLSYDGRVSNLNNLC
ncbi:WD repeat-containing protein DWA2 [Vitis vinifera]|uniref:WD repeat-containing protein DWA2 n=1 Tax=Vitis vinifera TaxID=29760 RepID=A0A438ET19_VITVI|nr:WD repeat-containing protein DWA2 [Vitis vinifera]